MFATAGMISRSFWSKSPVAMAVRFSSAKAQAGSSNLPSFETLAVTVPKPFVYHVELNRPDKLNTFNHTMWMELKQCFDGISSDEDCRVVVLSGRGKHFTAGIDLFDMMSWAQKFAQIDEVARKAKFLADMIIKYQESITSLETCIKPVIVAVHSACVGAGVDLITAADIRYCSNDAWFQVKEVDIGLAADVGTLQRLPKVIGNSSLARELCLTARKFDAMEAACMGLVSKVCHDKDAMIKEALSIAEQIAEKSPVAVQATKVNLVYSQNRTNQEGLHHIKLLNQLNLQSEDFINSCMAQATKAEKPVFAKL